MYLGIDPSPSSTGWAIINDDETIVEKGKIPGLVDDPKSFWNLFQVLIKLTQKYPEINSIGCEGQFMSMGLKGNPDTTIKTVRPTGVVLAVTGASGIESFKFFKPASWRKILFTDVERTRKGPISKSETFKVLKARYNTKEKVELQSFKKDNDIADAIGIAIATKRSYLNE